MRYEVGKQYLGQWLAIVAVAGGAFWIDNRFNGRVAASLLIPAAICFYLAALEFYSGVALDRWWRGAYTDDSPMFWVSILAKCFGAIAFSAAAANLMK